MFEIKYTYTVKNVLPETGMMEICWEVEGYDSVTMMHGIPYDDNGNILPEDDFKMFIRSVFPEEHYKRLMFQKTAVVPADLVGWSGTHTREIDQKSNKVILVNRSNIDELPKIEYI